mmetsp:Transcript_8905/g.7871  ORF Transcript_8905/g.7871 Transcript_8905/m.7871 type:complete len:142 (-) Transcript_8905:68-493(-)
MMGQEPRQTTSNIGHLEKPSLQALYHGLNKHYYSININYRKNELEQKMLLNLYKKKWNEGLKLEQFDDHAKHNEKVMKTMSNLAKDYTKWIEEEMKKTTTEMVVSNVGKINPKKHLSSDSEDLMSSNILQNLSMMIDTKTF